MGADPNRTRFIHVRCQQTKMGLRGHCRVGNVYGVTIAMEPCEGGWQFAFALCAEADNYSKKRGRQIAAGRLHAPERTRLRAMRRKALTMDGRHDFLRAADTALFVVGNHVVNRMQRYPKRRDEYALLLRTLEGERGRIAKAIAQKEAQRAKV